MAAHVVNGILAFISRDRNDMLKWLSRVCCCFGFSVPRVHKDNRDPRPSFSSFSVEVLSFRLTSRCSFPTIPFTWQFDERIAQRA
jgi:hypothetical protein